MKQIYEMGSFKQLVRLSIMVGFVTLFSYIMAPFLIPVLIGGIFAAGLNPAVEFLIRRRFRRKLASLIVIITFFLCGFLPLLFSCVRGIQILYEYSTRPGHIDFKVKILNLISEFSRFLGDKYKFDAKWIEVSLTNKINVFENFLLQNLEVVASELPSILFLAFVGLITLYLCLRNGDTIRHALQKTSSNQDSREKVLLMLEQCSKDIFVTNIITGFLQALIVSLGCAIFQTGDFFVIFVLTFLLSFIPVAGAAPVAVLMAILNLMEMNYIGGVGLLIVAIVAGVSDNLIRPYLVSRGSIKIHPFVNFLSIIGGVLMFGFAGLFIGPFTAGVCFGAIPIIFVDFISYFKEKKESKL